jgi:hypothetical protein
LRNKIGGNVKKNKKQFSKMPQKKYIVSLTPSERNFLAQLTKKGKTAAYKMNHARSRIILTAYRTNNAGERIPEAQVNCGQR